MPVGYVVSVGVVALGVLAAWRPVRRTRWLGRASWVVSAIPNESPFLAVYWLLAINALAYAQGDLDSTLGVAAVAVVALTVVLGVVLVRRSLRSGSTIDAALDQALEWWCRDRRLPWFRIVLAPVPILAVDLKRTSNVPYGTGDRKQRLDVYRHRTRPPTGPVLIHLHGGHFRTGKKSFEARPLLHRLARHGWVCISANYRLSPNARWPDFLVDAKAVIVWARAHAANLGADPQQLVIAGSSAGAHLAVSAALTANDRSLQPGFEAIDTTVAAAVGLYGYYGPVDTAAPLPSSPSDFARPDAPPILIAHGDHDTYVSPANPRRLVDDLCEAGAKAVVYIELPGAQHSFDLVHSIRFEAIITAIESFAASTRGCDRAVPTSERSGPPDRKSAKERVAETPRDPGSVAVDRGGPGIA